MTPETWTVAMPLFLLLAGYFVWKGERRQRGRRVWFCVASLGALGVVWGMDPDVPGVLIGVMGGLMGAMRATLERRGVFQVVVIVLAASTALAAQEHRTGNEFAREPPAAERSGYVVAVPAHLSPRFSQSVINAVRRLVDRMVEEQREQERTQRRLASALGSPLTSSAPSNWWNWPLTGGIDSVRDGDAPTDGPPGPPGP